MPIRRKAAKISAIENWIFANHHLKQGSDITGQIFLNNSTFFLSCSQNLQVLRTSHTLLLIKQHLPKIWIKQPYDYNQNFVF